MSCGLTLYRIAGGAATALATPYLAARGIADRRELRERLGDWRPIDPALRGGLWLHAASVGEARAASTLLSALSARGASPLLSVTTPAARRLAPQLEAAGARLVRHAPLDLSPCVRRVLREASPRALLVLETEIWPLWLDEASRARLPVAFVSARLSGRSLRRLRPWRGALRPLLAPAAVAAQSEADAARWIALGADPSRVRVTGNLKYDRPRGPLEPAARAAARGAWRRVVVFGSVRSGEIARVAEAIAALRSLPGPTLFVVAPRHPERTGSALRRALAPLLPVVERRATAPPLLPPADGSCASALLVSTVGELRSLYALADAAFVGGTLAPIGGHNLFEAAELAVPVLFGPHHGLVADVASALERHGGGACVRDGAELADRLRVWLAEEGARGLGALAAAEELGGALAATLQALEAWGLPVLGEGAR